jgi:integrase/recombinase XerD
MNLLYAGADTSVVALWFGYESTKATQIYLHADMAIKERTVAGTTRSASSRVPIGSPDTLLAFLEAL